MDKIEQAAEIIKQGGIVIFPTDTAFGIGCDLTNENAVNHLFEIRNRPAAMATPVLFDTVERVREFVYPVEDKVENLMNEYWPGALTLILRCQKSKVPSLVRGGGETLGVRIPNHEVPREIIRLSNVPILGPSANFHKNKTPFKIDELDNDLLKLVDFIVEGETNEFGSASTVLDCSSDNWKIIREGVIKIKI